MRQGKGGMEGKEARKGGMKARKGGRAQGK
jgi:hypothetical protein